jgi:hypothetical protein
MTEDGYVTNIYNGNKLIDLDKKAARIRSVYDNGDNVDAMIMLEYEDRDRRARFTGLPAMTGPMPFWKVSMAIWDYRRILWRSMSLSHSTVF